MTLTNYINLITEQRIQQPLYPKDYRVNSLITKNITSVQELTKLISYPNSFIANIIQRNEPLFIDVDDLYYYEFIDLGPAYRTTFTDWKYFYIPLSKKDDLVTALPNILPTINYYNVETVLAGTLPLIKQTLAPFTRPNNFFFTEPKDSNLHPYINNFKFTGYSFIINNGKFIFEYQDLSMYNDDISVTYYSELRPLDYFIKSTVVEEYGFIQDPLFSNSYLNPPGYLEFYTDRKPQLGFTGNVTTRLFTSTRRWFEYYIYEELSPSGRILLPYPPTNKSIDFVDSQLNNTVPVINFQTTFHIQNISVNQISHNKKIVLEP